MAAGHQDPPAGVSRTQTNWRFNSVRTTADWSIGASVPRAGWHTRAIIRAAMAIDTARDQDPRCLIGIVAARRERDGSGGRLFVSLRWDHQQDHPVPVGTRYQHGVTIQRVKPFQLDRRARDNHPVRCVVPGDRTERDPVNRPASQFDTGDHRGKLGERVGRPWPPRTVHSTHQRSLRLQRQPQPNAPGAARSADAAGNVNTRSRARTHVGAPVSGHESTGHDVRRERRRPDCQRSRYSRCFRQYSHLAPTPRDRSHRRYSV